MNLTRRIFTMTVCVALTAMLAGCAGSLLNQQRGSINQDPDILKDFESFKINPEFHYYVSGPPEHPTALIGLRKTYKLETPSSGWKRIEPTPEMIRDIVQNMQKKAAVHKLRQRGFALRNDREQTIGVWYSILSATTSVRMRDDHTVSIAAPYPDSYERLDNDWKELYKGI